MRLRAAFGRARRAQPNNTNKENTAVLTQPTTETSTKSNQTHSTPGYISPTEFERSALATMIVVTWAPGSMFSVFEHSNRENELHIWHRNDEGRATQPIGTPL